VYRFPRSCMPLPLRCPLMGNGYGDAELSDLCERLRLRVHVQHVRSANSVDTLSFKWQIYLDAIGRANAESRGCSKRICLSNNSAGKLSEILRAPMFSLRFRQPDVSQGDGMHSRDVHGRVSVSNVISGSRRRFPDVLRWRSRMGCMQRRYPDCTLSTCAQRTKSTLTAIRKNPNLILIVSRDYEARRLRSVLIPNLILNG